MLTVRWQGRNHFGNQFRRIPQLSRKSCEIIESAKENMIQIHHRSLPEFRAANIQWTLSAIDLGKFYNSNG